MDVESGNSLMSNTALQKPTSLPLRRSNNKMMDKITGNTENHPKTNGISKVSSEKQDLPCHAEVVVVNEIAKTENKPNTTMSRSEDQTCMLFGQIIDNEDETWDFLSNAASWESSFPKQILSDSNSIGSAAFSEMEEEDLPPGWKKISDSAGSYYWNVQTGQTQSNPPTSCQTANSTTTTEEILSPCGQSESATHRDGHMFIVRSLGWLPMEADNLKPDISSAAVNSCIRHLSNNRSQIMDGVGVWGEGKDFMLNINGDQLKIVDPSEDKVLQTQPIKNIRVWGVGRDSCYDFAYVVRNPSTKVYQCHVFKCDTPAQAIAKQLHSVCSYLVSQKKLAKRNGNESNLTDVMPVASSEPCRIFEARYIGSTKVDRPSGIDIVKQAIANLTENLDIMNLKTASVSVSASALVVDNRNGDPVVNCRMRCLSFMGVGDDVKLFGFISVIADQATCHILHCEPNSAKLALAVQEACMLRYQKAIDSKQCQPAPTEATQNKKSLKTRVVKLFSGLRRSGS